jgi:hypothetical protein
MMTSAKMKAITPPKLMPPRQSTAASGTLPHRADEADHDNVRTNERSPDLSQSAEGRRTAWSILRSP